MRRRARKKDPRVKPAGDERERIGLVEYASRRLGSIDTAERAPARPTEPSIDQYGEY
jgi:hypothetical protein